MRKHCFLLFVMLIASHLYAQHFTTAPGRILLYPPETQSIMINGFDSLPPFMEYYPAKQNTPNRTAILICPGGGYGHLAWEKEGVLPAKFFNENGIDAFVLSYRLNNEKQQGHRYPDQYNDATLAMRTIRLMAQQYGIDPAKVGIMGFSAGGHLASTVTTIFQPADPSLPANVRAQDAKPAFSILMYPVITMSDTVLTHRGSHNNLLGRTPDPQLEQALSTEKRVTAGTPPVLLIHADDDKVVLPLNSIVFYEAMKKQGVKGSLFIFDHGGHGFGMAAADPVLSKWPALALQWVHSQGF